MVEISSKYKIGTRRFGSVNWIGAWTLYKKEVLRFLNVWIQTIFSPLISALLFLLVLSLAIGADRGNVLGVPFINFLAPGLVAMQVIQQGLCNVTEFYGSECTLYYPGLYAGQTDLIASHKNEMAVIDFKQTNKPKKREWIEDYCLQLAAYGMAHDFVYKTAITKAVIMMCSKDNYYQEFIIEGEEYRKYKHKWLRRVDEYYKGRSKTTG